MWQYAASAGINMLSAGLQAKEQMKAESAHNELKFQESRIASNRETESTLFNISSIKQQEVSDMANIGLAAARAEDEALMARAASGLEGTSMNDLDAEILIDVNKDKQQVARGAAQNINEQTKGLRYANENRVFESNNRKINTKPKSMVRNALLSSAGSALGSDEFGGIVKEVIKNRRN
jgi:hypothetical protein